MDPFVALERAVALAHARLALLTKLDSNDPATVRIEGEALDRLLRASRACADLDLAERQQMWVQRTGAVIARAFGAALADDPDISDARRARLVARFADELGRLEARHDSFGPLMSSGGPEAAADPAPRLLLADG